MPGWSSLRNLVREEITQCSEEGCNVAGFQERWESALTNAQMMELYWICASFGQRRTLPMSSPRIWRV